MRFLSLLGNQLLYPFQFPHQEFFCEFCLLSLYNLQQYTNGSYDAIFDYLQLERVSVYNDLCLGWPLLYRLIHWENPKGLRKGRKLFQNPALLLLQANMERWWGFFFYPLTYVPSLAKYFYRPAKRIYHF